MLKSLIQRLGTAEKMPPWGIGAVLLTIAVSFIAIVLGTIIGGTLFAPSGAVLGEGITPFALQFGWVIGLVVTIVFVYQSRRTPNDRAALRLMSSSTPIPLIMFITIGFALFIDLITQAVTGTFLRVPELINFDAATAGIAGWAVAIALMLVVQPIAEELVFRGVAFPALRAVMGGWLGWVTVALLYGIFHYALYAPNYNIVGGNALVPLWYGLIVPLLDALVIGAVRAYTGSTRAAMFAHATFGLFALAKLLIIAG
jgi:membrane protease YdiL (CAAX protease family)